MLKENLLGSFGKNVEQDGVLNKDANEENILEHSFFKHLPEVIVGHDNANVMNFNLNEPNPLDEEALEMNTNAFLKHEIGDYCFNPGSDILFSGYFGTKNDEDNINGNKDLQKNGKRINPFPIIEEERGKQNSYDPINRVSKKMRLDKSVSLTNCSFISSHSRNKSSFNELVKSVSLSNFNSISKKKSKETLNLELLSTEEIELEKIRKEKEELKRLKQINSHMAGKVYLY
jgi:hypothetical protein